MYLQQILQKYHSNDLNDYFVEIERLKTLLKSWAANCYINIHYSGSQAKGTAISLSSDLDLLISLTNNCSVKNERTSNLSDIYNALYNTLSKTYVVKKQNVSIRVHIPANSLFTNGLEVDVTPARKQVGNTNVHSLFVSKFGTWKQTNIKQHIQEVASAGRNDEIRLLKIWRELNSLEFPSIYLEYLIITNILKNRPKSVNENDLSGNFWRILQELANNTNNPLFSRIVDPANSTNILSDLLNPFEKNKIIVAAKNSITFSDWKCIVW